jgi:hypothetical protein
VVNYGAATNGDVCEFVEGHAGHLGRDTIHVCILAWSGNDFTSGAGRTASAYKRKPRRFTDRAEYLDSAERLGTALEHYDAAWVIGPGSSLLWDAFEQFDESAGEFLAAVVVTSGQKSGLESRRFCCL